MSAPHSTYVQTPPKPVRQASVAMFVLAGLYLFGAVLGALGFVVGGLWLAARDEQGGEGLAVTGVVFAVAALAVLVALVWLAVRVRRGDNWARVAATLLLALGALSELGRTWANLAADPVVIPLISIVGLILMVAALALLWGPTESRTYFATQAVRGRD